MAPNPMPTASGSQQTLSGKSAPDCLFAAGCALACRGKGGLAAHRAGQSFTQVQRCELQSEKAMYQDYMQCMPAQEDKEVTNGPKWKIYNVVKGLQAAASGFEAMPADVKDQFTEQRWRSMGAEQVATAPPLEPPPPSVTGALD